MQGMLSRYGAELGVAALPVELTAAANRTVEYLKSNAAKVTLDQATLRAGKLEIRVQVQNLGGHRLPTAYPSRRVWLHVLVTDSTHTKVFESGALNADGSIEGNDNDSDATRFEPHYPVIRSADQVQIYESVLSDSAGRVTTGLLNSVGYLKDNRLLPRGFDKTTATAEIAVIGSAATDSAFNDAGHTISYSIDVPQARSMLNIEVELLYQPIGYRWAHNLEAYDATEPRRFVTYFESMKSVSAVVLATAKTTARAD